MKSDYIDEGWLVTQVELCQQSGPRMRRRALDKLLEAIWPRILQIAIRQQRKNWGAISSWTLAEDAAIHASIALMEKIDSITEPAGLFKWINRVVRNYLLSKWYGHAKEVLTDEIWPFDTPRRYDYEAFSIIERLRIALVALPHTDRWLIYVHYWEEKSVKEIAELENVRPQTISGRLTRLRRRLRQILLNEGYSSWADTGTD